MNILREWASQPPGERVCECVCNAPEWRKSGKKQKKIKISETVLCAFHNNKKNVFSMRSGPSCSYVRMCVCHSPTCSLDSLFYLKVENDFESNLQSQTFLFPLLLNKEIQITQFTLGKWKIKKHTNLCTAHIRRLDECRDCKFDANHKGTHKNRVQFQYWCNISDAKYFYSNGSNGILCMWYKVLHTLNANSIISSNSKSKYNGEKNKFQEP